MIPKLGYYPADTKFPFTGLDVNTPAGWLEPGASPHNLNGVTFRGSLKKRLGFAQLGSTLNGGTEPVVKLWNFQKQDGTNLLVAFTPTKIYSYASGTWTDRTPVSVPFTGTEDNFIDVAEGVDVNLGRLIVAVNGKDGPIYWDGVASKFIALPVNLASFVTAKTVAVFNSYLIFANIKTTSGWEPRSAAWSDTGVFTEWLAGNSGVLAEMNFDGEILRLIPYATNLVVFSRNTIGCLCYIDPSVIFGSTIYVTGIKLIAPGAISYVNPYIMFVSQDNIHLWDGARVTVPCGDKIVPIIRTAGDPTYINRANMFYDITTGQVRFVMPTGASSQRVLALESDLGVRSLSYVEGHSKLAMWYEESYPVRMSSFGPYIASTGGQNVNSVVLGGSNGKVYVESGQLNDDGTAIQFIWDSGDITVPQVYRSQYARWLELEFEALGTAISTYYSTDSGVTWTLIATTTLASTFMSYKVFFDTTSRVIRFRFTSNDVDSAFELAWYRAWLRPGAAR